MNFAEEIKLSVKMPDIIEKYGIEQRKGRIRCPLHNGTDYNCGIKADYIHCFVCGESADQISFVQKYFGLNFKEAIEKLNCDFLLGLPIGQKIDKRRATEMARKSFVARQERERANKEYEEFKKKREKALFEYIRLERAMREEAPKNEDDFPSVLFIEACQKISRAEFDLDVAESELREYEKRNNRNS